MTQITQSHAEWAVVDRFRTMLNESPDAKYNVTKSFGLCVAILAWVMQRVRTPESYANSPEDRAAISVRLALEKQSVVEMPWALKNIEPDQGRENNTDFIDFSAFAFLKWLRDATCHGDARQIFPINKNGCLIGFEFRTAAKNDIERTLFLDERGLRRVGSLLADLFCRAIQEAVLEVPETFANDARSLVEKRNIA